MHDADGVVATQFYSPGAVYCLTPTTEEIARERGFFAKQGMTGVELKKQTSWAVTRDNLELGGAKGGIDGAHILSPMPLLLTAGTITKAATALKNNGAERVLACAVHGVLSGPAIERLAKAPIERVVLTNTIPLPADKRLPKIEVLSVAKILADALAAVFDETSVSDLFDGENQS